MATELDTANYSDEILRQLRPTSRGKTSYTSMNDWLHKPGRTVPLAKPVFRDLNDWRPAPTRELADKTALRAAEKNLTPGGADPAKGSHEAFLKSYNNLTNQIAYRWPNPGSPRAREGGIGGTWRHIKEVLCHGGSRTVFVDGLVSVYDDSKFTDRLQASLTDRPHVRPNPHYCHHSPRAPPSPNTQTLLPSVAPLTTTHRASFNPYPVLPAVASKGAKNQMPHFGRYPNGPVDRQ